MYIADIKPYSYIAKLKTDTSC